MDIDNLVKNMGLVDAFADTIMPDHVLENQPVCGENCISCTQGCSTGCFNTANA